VVEYSAGETADDHLIARLERLPPQPVIVVTNDKELQQRASALRATVASSDQLLALAR
jgi:rRNA-processing protein FCF1